MPYKYLQGIFPWPLNCEMEIPANVWGTWKCDVPQRALGGRCDFPVPERLVMIERRDEEKRRQAGVPFWSNATLGLEGGIRREAMDGVGLRPTRKNGIPAAGAR